MFVWAATAFRDCKRPATAKTFRFRLIRTTSTDPSIVLSNARPVTPTLRRCRIKSELKPVQCDTCHTASVKAYSESIHAKARAQGFKEPPTCTSCHGDIHKLVPRSELSSPVHPTNIAKTCAICHANTEMAKKFRIPVVRPVEAYLQSVHARAVSAGKGGAVCTDCHGAHTVLPASDASSQISRPKVPETCGRCHANVLTAYRQSIHGEAARAASGTRPYVPIATASIGSSRAMSQTRRYSRPTSPVKLVVAAMPIRE